MACRQPQQMAVGMPGKVGYLRLGFELRHGRSILADLYRVAPLLVQQALYWDEALPGMPYAMIISTGGGTALRLRPRPRAAAGCGSAGGVGSASSAGGSAAGGCC